jgi:hypothetical protein
MMAALRTPGPAYANLQGWKPWDMWKSSVGRITIRRYESPGWRVTPEPVIGPRLARTRWASTRLRATGWRTPRRDFLRGGVQIKVRHSRCAQLRIAGHACASAESITTAGRMDSGPAPHVGFRRPKAHPGMTAIMFRSRNPNAKTRRAFLRKCHERTFT